MRQPRYRPRLRSREPVGTRAAAEAPGAGIRGNVWRSAGDNRLYRQAAIAECHRGKPEEARATRSPAREKASDHALQARGGRLRAIRLSTLPPISEVGLAQMETAAVGQASTEDHLAVALDRGGVCATTLAGLRCPGRSSPRKRERKHAQGSRTDTRSRGDYHGRSGELMGRRGSTVTKFHTSDVVQALDHSGISHRAGSIGSGHTSARVARAGILDGTWCHAVPFSSQIVVRSDLPM